MTAQLRGSAFFRNLSTYQALWITLPLLGLAASHSAAQAAWRVQAIVHPGRAQPQVLSAKQVLQAPSFGQAQQKLRSIPAIMPEGAPPSRELYEEILFSDHAFESVRRHVPIEAVDTGPVAWPGSEVRTLVSQGPTANRINLTIVGDGYTTAEKGKFFDDALRITQDLFGATTFKSHLPLFNVFAVFVPSAESGLTGTRRVNTALKLYRSPPEAKRAIIPGDTAAAERAIKLAPATDYPILLANDDYYGGLGGRYAITTRSHNSGSMVLRHELGHNFGEVGEEYDGGGVYSGANFSGSSNLPWKQWISGAVVLHDAEALAGDYAWYPLAQGPYRVDFTFPANTGGQPYYFEAKISSVGWSTPEDVHVFIDGQRVPIEGVYTPDRSFFRIPVTRSFAPGKHTLEFRENVRDGDNVLAYARAYAYAPNYNGTQNVYGGFETFDHSGRMVGYRPTHESCLMRDMRKLQFCTVDLENFWHKFLARVKLIDELKVETSQDGSQKRVTLMTPPLPGIEARWFRVGAGGSETEIVELRNQRTWVTPPNTPSGTYAVRLQFRTPEVRVYNARFDGRQEFNL